MVVIFDVIIIGAGIIGCSIARELARYNLSTMVIEKNSDVSTETTKANSGIVHSGFDAKTGTLKAKYNVAGQEMFESLSKELDFPYTKNGALVLCFDKEDIGELEKLLEQGKKNGLTDLKIIFNDEIQKLEPNVNGNVYAALFAPSSGIVCPYEMTIAYADNAAINGVEFNFDCMVTNIKKETDHFTIATNKGQFNSKIVINAAGLYSDKINNMLSEHVMTIVPRRGEYLLTDKIHLVNRTIFQLPTKMGKGVLITRTTSGNVILGPTSEDIDDIGLFSTTKDGLDIIIEKAGITLKQVPKDRVITSFTGLRAHLTSHNDFIIGESEDVKGLINLCGIESPGLTSAPAISKAIGKLVKDILNPTDNESFNPNRKAIIKFANLSDEDQAELIKKDKAYGNVICRCETVTKAEVLQALRSPVPARDLDGVKRRTRVGMGRCQGGFCLMHMLDIIKDELNIQITEVTKDGKGSNVLIGQSKKEL